MNDEPISVIVITGCLVVVSLICWSMALVRWTRGQPLLEPVPQQTPSVHWGAVVLVCASIFPNLVAVLHMPGATSSAIKLSAVQYGCLFRALLGLAVLLPLVTNPQTSTESLGFRLTNFARQVRDGVHVYFLSLLPVFAVWYAASPWRKEEDLHPLLKFLRENSSFEPVAWVFFAAAVIAPLYEELLYRVVLQTGLELSLPRRAALVATAVIFAAVHGMPDSVPLLPLALLLGYLYQQRRSFAANVITHSLFNATNLLFAWLSANAIVDK